ncbi:MAG: hypothetical protein ACE37H_17015 [Phycisphaeraceae bacterium]
MSGEHNNNHETDKRFPSGLWMGYWMQGYIKGRMRLTLEFSGGKITGEGTDPVGLFDMKGIYSLKHNMVSMVKRYRGAHSVGYVGGAADGGLNGTWQILRIPQIDEWRLWPVKDEHESVCHAAEEEDGPVVLIGDIEVEATNGEN